MSTVLRRIRRQVLFVAAHLVLVFVPTPRLWADAPAAVKASSRQVFTIYAPAGRCLGAPISASFLLTANHCTNGTTQVQWEAPDGRRGVADVIYRQPARDVALCRIEGQFTFWLRTAAELPGEAETVWAKYFIPGAAVVALIEGRFIAEVTLDGDRHCVLVDGVSGPGSSGGVLLNSRGEVVAVMSQSWNPGLTIDIGRGFLSRSIAIFRSVVGGIGKL